MIILPTLFVVCQISQSPILRSLVSRPLSLLFILLSLLTPSLSSASHQFRDRRYFFRSKLKISAPVNYAIFSF